MKDFLDLQRQARKALPHVGMAGRQPDSNAARKGNHRRRSCLASASITRDSVASSGAPSIVRRSFAPNAIVIVPRLGSADGRSAAAALTAIGMNAGPSPAAAYCCRHRYNRLVLTQARRATSDAFASGSFNAKIQRIFSARVQCRRFSLDVMISTAVMAPVLCLRTEPVLAINRDRGRRRPSDAYYAATISLTLWIMSSGSYGFCRKNEPAGRLSSGILTCPDVTMIFTGGQRPRT
jgi:hypothetical protein